MSNLEILAIIFFIFGICVGSFCNVLIYRLPRNESINFPASHCPNCKTPLKFYHNVPIFSWLFLGGKCGFCKEKISARYPIIEFLAGALALACLYHEASAIQNTQTIFNAAIFALCFITLLALSVIDIGYKAVPSSLLYAATAFALIYAISEIVWYAKYEALLNAFYFAFGFWLLRAVVSLIIKREALGEADIYIAAIIGAILSLKLALMAIYIAAILTLPFYLFIRKKGYELAFVPFLSAGLFIVYLFDSEFDSFIGLLYE